MALHKLYDRPKSLNDRETIWCPGCGHGVTTRLIAEVRKAYRPNLVLAASAFPAPEEAPELLTDRPMTGGKATAYVCEGFVCRLPVTDGETLGLQLAGGN